MNKELLEKTIQCLLVTFTSQSKEDRDPAEKELKEICNNYFTLASDFRTFSFTAIQGFKLNLIPTSIFKYNKAKIQVSLSIYLKNIIKEKIDKKTMNIEDAFTLLKSYSEIIFELELDNPVLLNLSNSLQLLLNCNIIYEKQEIIADLILLVQNIVMNLKNEKLLKNIITFLENLILSTSINKDNTVLNVSKILELTNNILKYILDKIKSNSVNLEFYNSTQFIF